MKIVVFGASGRTGRSVVAQAVRRGDDVIAFVRDASKQWFPDAAKIHQGRPSDADAVEAALIGSDAVISALGPITEETTTQISDATRTIVEAMERIGPHRIAIAANAKVFSVAEVAGPYANVAAEHRRDAAILRESALDWTVVAAPILTDDPATGSYVAVVDGKGPGRSITRGDFATALLDAVEKDAWIRHLVGVTNPPVPATQDVR
ncbi:MAG: NAD(P)-dependent oxidoreductase [Actinomycetota bacterium]